MSNEALVRFVAFAGVLAALAAWELLAPRRPRSLGRMVRWPSNIGMVVLDTVLVEVLLNAISMFNHSNIAMPLGLDRLLRWIVVTPDMHRIHHSMVVRETNSNFGFNLPWWDRLFGTYRDQPEQGHERMTIGIQQFREIGEQRLDRMLTQPFRGKAVRSSLLP